MSYSKRAWCEPEAEWPVISLDDEPVAGMAGASGMALREPEPEPREPSESDLEQAGQLSMLDVQRMGASA